MSAVGQTSTLKELSSLEIDFHREELYQISSEIWHNPELAYKEHKAHSILTSYLEEKGFTVDRAYTGIPTAFRATIGRGRPNVCVLCEYDALPDIGHACGHNLIAEAGVAAGMGLRAVLEKCKDMNGTVTVLGSPAEEEFCGKVDLINNGAFKDIDVAMMYHPAPYSVLKPIFVACVEVAVGFTGKAAAFPWERANALDAAIMAYNSISVFRQQMKPKQSVHGILKSTGNNFGGDIIPEKSEMNYYIRGPTIADTNVLMKKCQNCFEAAAEATGCSLEILRKGSSAYDLQSNNTLAELYMKNAMEVGLSLEEELPEVGSTDMGNVSYVVPSIYPMLKIGNGEVYHTREFTGMKPSTLEPMHVCTKSYTPHAHTQ